MLCFNIFKILIKPFDVMLDFPMEFNRNTFKLDFFVSFMIKLIFEYKLKDNFNYIILNIINILTFRGRCCTLRCMYLGILGLKNRNN